MTSSAPPTADLLHRPAVRPRQVLRRPREQELSFQGVYRVGDDPKRPALLVDDFDRPNGLCFSLDGRRLFINDTARQHIRVFDVTADGALSGGRLWAETVGEGPGARTG